MPMIGFDACKRALDTLVAAAKADLGSFAGWTRRAENAAGAFKRVYMELDGELK